LNVSPFLVASLNKNRYLCGQFLKRKTVMKTKIAIVGLGGVGGYFGGMLAKQYAENPEVEIYFVARGEHLKKIKEFGLKLITENGTFHIFPTLATDNIAEIGTVDYIIMTPKSYDLDSTVVQIKPMIGPNTVILPLLNGIDNSERIRDLLPETEVWDGCCYIVAKINEPGVVENSGSVHRLVFGYQNQTSERLLSFEKLLKEAGLEAEFHKDILTSIWKKFLFISSSASLTSYFDVTYGALLIDESRKETFDNLLIEFLQVANAEGIAVDKTDVERLIHQIKSLPFETTTSMHRDFTAGKNTEVQSLTGIVVKLGKKHGIETPTYDMVYSSLLEKMKV
jgi:2-dehydropantoate 2-reductase